jgi:hypothetical protein
MKNKMKMLYGLKAVMFMSVLLIASACDTSNEPVGNGEAEFVITDAPVDDANVKSVFVTVADIRIDGKSISGFAGRQTIDLMAYQEGKTKLLGMAQLAAKSYGNLTLVLDLDADANGNAPGCYVQTANNTKHKLATTASGTMEITLSKTWRVYNQTKSKIVLDFDLRKAIRYADGTASYSFVTANDLKTAIRVVANEKAATIKGQYEDEIDADNEQIIVYAYKKGTFNAQVESQPNENGLAFVKAVSSTRIKAGLLVNDYTLAFMEEGEYQLVFVHYSKNQTSGKFEFTAILSTETEVNGSLTNFIQVKAGATVNVSAKIKA